MVLIEGVTKKNQDGTIERGHFNVLIVSDPGMAKTKLLQFVSTLLPKGQFANATTSTKVGLVAPVVKDEETGSSCISAGAYMRANGGILCLDEISEFNEDDFKYLNESMESGVAHINKAGINTVVQTRASLLAACNPIEGCFNPTIHYADQVKIPAPTLSRFDLKLTFPDNASEERDTKITEHIIRNHRGECDMSNLIMPDMLRKYISYARRIKPEILVSSSKILINYYISTRKSCIPGVIKPGNRQFQSLIRLSEAHAKMRLSKTVDTCDAEAAVELFDMVLRNVNVDPKTGIFNIAASEKKSKKTIPVKLLQVIKDLSKDTGKAKESAVIEAMAALGDADQYKVLSDIQILSREGMIMQPTDGLWRII
jgi:replicative DNA helicase Mcm